MPRVLVADDDKNVLEMVQRALSDRGYAVETAIDGLDAMERMEKELPDLVILDIAMTRLDGYTIATRLRDDPKTKSLPVIIITARGQMQTFLHQHPNVKAFLEKPFNPLQLVEIVAGLIGGKKQ